MTEKSFELLIPYYRGHSNGESEDAEKLFKTFIENGFSYDEVLNAPDYMVYASAELLARIFPQMIDEMLRRNDTGKFLIFPMSSAIDPEGNTIKAYIERTASLIEIADKAFSEKVIEFLVAVKSRGTLPQDQCERLLNFWKEKTKVS